MCDRSTVRRAQLVVAQALQNKMFEKLEHVFNSSGESSVIVLKRLWDETSCRLQVSSRQLKALLGEEVAAECEARKKRGRGGRGSSYPSHFVQVMQQMGYVRWSSAREDCAELVLPAKVCATTTADALWGALISSVPPLGPDRLHALSQRIRALVLYQFPDGLAANRVVMQEMAELCPFALHLPGHCLSHLLQIVWDSGSQKQLANPLFGFCQLMKNSTSNAKVAKAIESKIAGARVVVGIAPPDLAYNEFILEYTLRRPLKVLSYFTQPGGRRHDPSLHAALLAQLDEDCKPLVEGLTGPWSDVECCHYCWGPLPGNRCCASNAECKQKMASSLETLKTYCIETLARLAANKWSSISQCVAKISPGVLIHNVVPTAFKRSLATREEMQRLNQFIADSATVQDAASAGGRSMSMPTPFGFFVGRGSLMQILFSKIETPPFCSWPLWWDRLRSINCFTRFGSVKNLRRAAVDDAVRPNESR